MISDENKPLVALFFVTATMLFLTVFITYWDTRNMSEEEYEALVTMQQKLRQAPRDSFITIEVADDDGSAHYETYIASLDGHGVYLGSDSSSHQFNSKYLSYNNVWRGPNAHHIVTDVCYPEDDCWKSTAKWFFLQ